MAGDWFTATSAAAAGGTTTVFAFSTQDKGGAGVLPMVEAYLAKANVGACIDYGIHVIVSDPTPEVINAFLLPTLLCGRAVATTRLLSLLTIRSFLVPCCPPCCGHDRLIPRTRVAVAVDPIFPSAMLLVLSLLWPRPH